MDGTNWPKEDASRGLISSLVMTLIYFGINGVALLLVVRFLHGVAFGIATTALATIGSRISFLKEDMAKVLAISC